MSKRAVPAARANRTVVAVLDAARTASAAVDALVARGTFGAPVAYVYNPLAYAWDLHEQYVRLALETSSLAARSSSHRTLLVGMNPGPFGMAQTGVPFGEVRAVTTWLGLRGVGAHGIDEARRPAREHPKRPVLGLACPRAEVSGARLWGAIAAKHADPRAFFAGHFVLNYCPLLFLDAGGRNLTPDKLAPAARAPLLAACDAQLAAVIAALAPTRVLGVGTWATAQAKRVIAGAGAIPLGTLPHPSPASPAANRGWPALARRALRSARIPLFL